MAVIGSFASIATWTKDGVVSWRAIIYSNELTRYNTAGMEIMMYPFHSEEKSNVLRITDILNPFDHATEINATDNFVNSARSAIRTGGIDI